MKFSYAWFFTLLLLFYSTTFNGQNHTKNHPEESEIDYTTQPFSIFPNPAKTDVTIISYHFSRMNTQLFIYNTSGKKIIAINELSFNDDHETLVNLDARNSGLYFIQLRSGNYSATKKLMKI